MKRIDAFSGMSMEAPMRDKQTLGPWIRRFLMEHLILALWFGPATAVKFGPLGQHWLGFMDGATEA